MTGTTQIVSGWGGSPKTRTRVVRAGGESDIADAIREVVTAGRGLIPRGLGRSYGDAAQRAGGITLEVVTSGPPEWLDRQQGIVRCPAGVSIADLIEFGAPYGFFVPVTPGTRHVTVGGAIAADIHGKDHHAVGSFGMHVDSLQMVLASGEAIRVDASSDPDLFWATIGGMGLTGVIVNADIRMSSVAGSAVSVDTFRTDNLTETMDALVEAESSHRYSVAWVDLSSTGDSMGRGVVTNGDHTETDPGMAPLHNSKVGFPSFWRTGLVNSSTVRAFNELWFRKAPKSPRRSTESYDSFFYPLDAVRNWNLAYGRSGFLQYQFVIPHTASSRLVDLTRCLAHGPAPVSFAVLKCFGQRSDGFMSFPIPGWTLAADIPLAGSTAALENNLRAVDEMVADAGGRVYLAKDSRLRADMLAAMYPQLSRFREVRRRVDPDRRLQSDLSARLGL